MSNTLLRFALGLAAALLACLLPMPYGYYTLVRFAALFILGLLSIGCYRSNRVALAWLLCALALLFQPFYPLELGRTVWNVADVAVAVLLVGIYYKERKRGHS